MFSCVTIKEQSALQDLVSSSLQSLRKAVVELQYPEVLKIRGNRALWADRYSEIDVLNKAVLESLKDRSGVYAILVAKPNKDWQLKYIGQTKAAGSKQRIRSHIVWRNKSTKSGKFTGSKFDEVQDAVSQKFDVAISFVQIEPESLRHYVEETLITNKQPSWNFNGTSLAGQRRSEHHCVL